LSKAAETEYIKKNLFLPFNRLASLLSKFRIEYADLIIITDVMAKAKESTREFFDNLVKEYKKNNEFTTDEGTIILQSVSQYITLKFHFSTYNAYLLLFSEMKLDSVSLKTMREKTNRHLRLRELLLDHSRQANLIVMTLPIPRKSGTPAPLYMAWLECLTRDMPPFLLVRGNQDSVLTYYS
jgi:solute carrier family 12 sodium/potassium/chloride transporter 2